MADEILYMSAGAALVVAGVAGATAGTWNTMLRIQKESQEDAPTRQFSYYDVLDAAYGAVWGGAVAVLATATGPLGWLAYRGLRAIRAEEEEEAADHASD